MTKKEQIIEMRNQGMTFQAIANKWGCSKQYVQEVCKKAGVKGTFHFRKCIYPNIRNWALKNCVSNKEFHKRCGYVKQDNLFRFLRHETIDMKRIKKILAVTGMTFEQAFGGTDCED